MVKARSAGNSDNNPVMPKPQDNQTIAQVIESGQSQTKKIPPTLFQRLGIYPLGL